MISNRLAIAAAAAVFAAAPITSQIPTRPTPPPPLDATLDDWWRGVLSGDTEARTRCLPELAAHAEAAAARGVHLLRNDSELSGQNLA
ncbi:MAG: hypothetical protein KDE27_26900, partial [Planctomycetes bacterium]|nr:hypothetical protein [Planctomycetota bacterium]